MGRLVLIILVLFSVTAIYSEANAAAGTACSRADDRSVVWHKATAARPGDRLPCHADLLPRNARR